MEEIHRRKQGKAKINNNNDNNNLILRSQPSQAPKWCMRTTCLWDKGPPPHSNLTAKVYRGVYTLPHSAFEQYDVQLQAQASHVQLQAQAPLSLQVSKRNIQINHALQFQLSPT